MSHRSITIISGYTPVEGEPSYFYICLLEQQSRFRFRCKTEKITAASTDSLGSAAGRKQATTHNHHHGISLRCSGDCIAISIANTNRIPEVLPRARCSLVHPTARCSRVHSVGGSGIARCNSTRATPARKRIFHQMDQFDDGALCAAHPVAWCSGLRRVGAAQRGRGVCTQISVAPPRSRG